MIYVHIPFCHRKCTYCAFYSRPAAAEARMEAYVERLVAEMEARRAEQVHPIRTVYFGGGTPSILPMDLLSRIVHALRRWYDLSHLEEATVECNPEDVTPQYAAALAALGFFNRVSLGVQSTDDEALHLIGRRHSAAQAAEAVARLGEAGFDNISVDFIYGLPTDFRLPDIDLAPVSHVSAYALTVEEGTALAAQVQRGRVALPGDDEVARQYFALRDFLERQGFEQYEVSNYARAGRRSVHNSRYWNRTPYLGLGAAAHSFDGRSRRWNVADVDAYCRGEEGGGETLTAVDAFNELLMTALRTTDGLSLRLVPEEYRERLHAAVQPYIRCGWIVFEGGCYKPSAEGLLHADGMAAALFVA